MKRKIKITESEKKDILKKYGISEQGRAQTIKNLVTRLGTRLGGTADDLLPKVAIQQPEVIHAITNFKNSYIQRYGQNSYNILVNSLITRKITKEKFISTLKTSKFPLAKSDFAAKVGVKFTEIELKRLSEIGNFISNNVNSPEILRKSVFKIPFTKKINNKIETHIGEVRFQYFSRIGMVDTTTAVAYVDDKLILINLDGISKVSKMRIKTALDHELAHLKDPKYISPKLQSTYGFFDPKFVDDIKAKKIIPWETPEWFERYYFHPYELTAIKGQLFQHMSAIIKSYKGKHSKETVKVALESIKNYFSGKDINNLHDLSYEILGYSGKNQKYELEVFFTELNKQKPEEYIKLCKEIIKQADYLLDEVNKSF